MTKEISSGLFQKKFNKLKKQKDDIITLILCEMNANDGSARAVQSDDSLRNYKNSKVMNFVKFFRHFGDKNKQDASWDETSTDDEVSQWTVVEPCDQQCKCES